MLSYFCRALVVLGMLSGLAVSAPANSSNMTVPTMVQLSTDSDFHFEILRDLSIAPYEGSDIGEVLTAAAQVVPMNFESFYSAFYKMAMRIYNDAQKIDSQKFPVSSRQAYFRASTYFRSADFYLHGNWSDSRINTLWDQQATAFDNGLALLPVPGKRITIQASNFEIPAIWYPASLKPGRRPTIIIGGGYDGGQEEIYHQMGQAGTQRGWNVITYEGPGQATPRREQNLGFILEWETVITPIVDYLYTRPDVDTSAIALAGLSFGGFLAPRAVAFEHRLAAVACLDGLYEFGPLFLQKLPAALVSVFERGNKTAFDALVHSIQSNTTQPSQLRWTIDQGLWAFNIPSPFDWLADMQRYTLDGVVEKIQTPLLAADAQDDLFFVGQGKVLSEKLGSMATYYLFETSEGSGEHAGVGANVKQNQVMYDWLAGIIGEEKLHAY